MKPLKSVWAKMLWAAVFLVAHTAAQAHKPSDSYLTLSSLTPATATSGKVITAAWDIALRDADYVLQLDRDGNGELTWGETRQRQADITQLATSALLISADGQACPWTAVAPMALSKHSDGTYAVLSLAAQCPQGITNPKNISVTYSLFSDVDPTHRGLVQWLGNGSTGDAPSSQALVFSNDSTSQALALAPGGWWQTFSQYVAEGTWHIWIGYDHILFLLALLLPAVLIRRANQWEPVPTLRGALIETLKVVTAFTLAHSITLSLAALQVISLPSRWVESVIAASVVLAALNNLRGTVEKRRWVMAFVFGLIHGFGFASVLADLGLPPGALVLALVGFNVGVELGQLAIVAAFLPLAFWLRSTRFYRVGVLTGGSILVAILASWWFLQRAFEL